MRLKAIQAQKRRDEEIEFNRVQKLREEAEMQRKARKEKTYSSVNLISNVKSTIVVDSSHQNSSSISQSHSQPLTAIPADTARLEPRQSVQNKVEPDSSFFAIQYSPQQSLSSFQKKWMNFSPEPSQQSQLKAALVSKASSFPYGLPPLPHKSYSMPLIGKRRQSSSSPELEGHTILPHASKRRCMTTSSGRPLRTSVGGALFSSGIFSGLRDALSSVYDSVYVLSDEEKARISRPVVPDLKRKEEVICISPRDNISGEKKPKQSFDKISSMDSTKITMKKPEVETIQIQTKFGGKSLVGLEKIDISLEI
eukprot:gnl/Carplike_NY0171/10062_a14128_188.p1 GENE.gnl/Carplike_NY0171/10062_a14128_188~~gnl/Carplike_NY0171/10062_a14128_188.p1  ORF type:complete len:310 (+),score=73.63 gnl/Carplike_NY0171/10062_a14128_188:225-1154(+)